VQTIFTLRVEVVFSFADAKCEIWNVELFPMMLSPCFQLMTGGGKASISQTFRVLPN